MIVTAQVSKWGNSLGVRIPKSLSESTNVKAGDLVELDIKKVNVLPTTLEEYLKSVNWDGRCTQEDEIDWGTPEGEEIW